MRTLTERIREHLRDPRSQHGRIASGFAWVFFFLLFGKVAGAAKEMTVAWRYGVSEVVDAYAFLYNLVTWPVSIWLSTLTMVLVPLLSRMSRTTHGEAPRFNRELLGLTLAAGGALLAVAWLGLPALLRSSAVNLPDGALSHALAMNAVLALILPLGLCASLFSARLLALGQHRNSLLEAVPPLTIIAALLLPSQWVPEPLVWGTVAGITLQLGGLAHPLRRTGALDSPRFAFGSPVWRDFWRAVTVMTLGQFLTSLAQVADQFFAADVGSGALSTLSYANRIAMLVLGIAATAIARATLPVFSEAHSRLHEGAGATNLGLRWAAWAFIASTVGSAAAVSLTGPGVQVLFERGAFHHENTVAVAALLRHLLLQTPFYAAGLVLVSVLAAQGRYSTLTGIAAVTFVAKLAAASLLVDRFQLAGLAWSTVAMYALALFLLVVAVRRRPASALPGADAS